ncbi:hypothetical protein TWF718_006711 [Orbilia javanica]|uniref:Ricin B lectin domain-containing protein n=1 Tax=Orbilia javanica TaxID=47235 RepID=A0AAN8RHX2_9PEZI
MQLNEGGKYRLINVEGGTVLDLSKTDDISIIGWENNDGDNQKWILGKNVTGQWTFRNAERPTIFLGITTFPGVANSATLQDGTRLAGVPEPIGWDIWPDDDDPVYFRISRPGGFMPDLNIDLANGKPKNGTPIVLWTKKPNTGKKVKKNQLWIFQSVIG